MLFLPPRSLGAIASIAGVVIGCLHFDASAQSLSWDLNPGVAGPQGGSGDWDGGAYWWNGASNQTWISGADALFGVDSGSVDASGVIVDDLTAVINGNWTLVAGQPGGVLTLGGSDGESVFSAGSPFRVSLPLVGQKGVKITQGGPVLSSRVIFEAANAYAGNTHIESGALEISGGSAIPDSSTVEFGAAGGGVFHVFASETIGALSGGAGTVNVGPLAGLSSVVLTIGANNLDTSFSGSVKSGAGTKVIKTGSGTTAFAGGNVSGALEIQSGKWVAQNPAASYGAILIGQGGVLEVNGGTLSMPVLNGQGEVRLTLGTLSLSGGGGTFSGQISGAGKVIYAGGSANAQTFTGSNIFTGGLLVSSGYIAAPDFGSEGIPGPLGAGPVTLNGGGLRNSKTIPLIADRPITIGSAGGFLAGNGASGTVIVRGLISGSGGLTIGAGGTVVLENPANSFTGITVQGDLALAEIPNAAANSVVGGGDSITVFGGRLLFTGMSDDSSDRRLIYSGSGTVHVSEANVSLRMDVATGVGGLVKSGPGTLIQTGSANDFGGNVTIAGGILQTGVLANSGTASALGKGNLIRFYGGQLSLAPGTIASTNRSIEVLGSARIQGAGNTTTLAGTISGSFPLTLAGVSAAQDTLILTGSSQNSGVLILDKATVRVTGSLTSAGVQFAASGGATLQLENAVSIAQITASTGADAGRLIVNAPLTVGSGGGSSSFGGRIEGTAAITKIGGGILALLGSGTFTGPILIEQGTLAVSDWTDNSAPPLGHASLIQLGSGVAPGSFAYNGSGTNTVNSRLSLLNQTARISVPNASATLVWAGNVEGESGTELNKDGAGTLRLSGANGFAGNTRILAGKLQVIGSNALPNGGVVQVDAGATLEMLPGTNETIGSLKGDGTVNLGGQKLTLNGGSESTSFGGLIVGAGLSRIDKRGSGTLTLTNSNSSFGGGVSVTDGAISVPFLRNSGVNSPLGSAGPITLGDASNNGRLIVTGANPGATNRPISIGEAGGTLEVAHEAAELSVSGNISGTGTLLKLGQGRLRFGGSFAGPIVVAHGTFIPDTDVAGRVTVVNPGIAATAAGPLRKFSQLELAGGTASPGGEGTAGVLSSDELMADSGTLSLDFISGEAGGYDQFILAMGLEIGAPIELNLNLQYDPIDGVDTFRVVTSGTPTLVNGPNGLFRYNNTLLEDGEKFLVVDGEYTQVFGIRYNPDGQNGVELFAVPEPGSTLLLMGGALCVMARRRRV